MGCHPDWGNLFLHPSKSPSLQPLHRRQEGRGADPTNPRQYTHFQTHLTASLCPGAFPSHIAPAHWRHGALRRHNKIQRTHFAVLCARLFSIPYSHLQTAESERKAPGCKFSARAQNARQRKGVPVLRRSSGGSCRPADL